MRSSVLGPTHVVDYGTGNLVSLSRALEAIGSEPIRCSAPKDLAGAERIVLPGVGAFPAAITRLADSKFVPSLLSAAANGVRILGVCLGMQLLFDRSSEFGDHAGLGILRGRVQPVVADLDRGALRSTHIGWRSLDWAAAAPPALLEGQESHDTFYFVHSYRVVPDNFSLSVATVKYGHNDIPAVVGQGNVWGVQFHPEKSRGPGLSLLRNLLYPRSA